MLKQLRKNSSFSIIEIIIALAFSSVLITTFIALSAWGLNNAKDNEVEDIASQSLMEMNDLLRSPQDVNISAPSYSLPGFYSINPADNKSILYISDITDFEQFNFNYCKGSGTNLTRITFKNADDTLSTQNVICVLAKITKVTANPLDDRYYYTVKVIAEKSNDKVFEETIDGMRVGKIKGPSGGGS